MRTLFIYCGIACLLLPTALAQLPAPPAKVMRYARAFIQRNDTNGDGILQRTEWENLPGTPRAIDIDGDQQITLDELVLYLTQYGRGKTIHRTIVYNTTEPYKFNRETMQMFRPVWRQAEAPPVPIQETEESPESTDTIEEMIKEYGQPVEDEDVYQQLLKERQIPANRPYHVPLSSLRGVPAWFIILDKNGDGQISLSEFAPTLAPARVRLFNQLDKNGNGLIEAHEVRSPQ